MNPQALFYLFAANIIGGVSYVGVAYALKGFTPVGVVFSRTLVGGICFIPFLISKRQSLHLDLGDWLRMAAVGVFGYALPLMLGTIGQKHSSATNASLLIGVEPVSIVFLSSIFLGEALTGIKAAAILSGILGASLIALQGIPGVNAIVNPHLKGDILLFLHGFFWSLYTVIGKPLLKKVDMMVFSGITTFFGFLAIALTSGPLTIAPSVWPSHQALAAVVFLGVAVTFYGVVAWNKALEMVEASRLANFIFLQPLIGVCLGVLLQNDHFSVYSGVGGALILLGVYGASWEPVPVQSHGAASNEPI